jgi:methionine synthase I (cobalamin-dependent)/5,10-methylenetetrahydrofolate reductase
LNLQPFLKALNSTTSPFLSDGAMGTLLNSRGAAFDQCLDALNLSQPDLVAMIHREYLQAGAQVIQTNTFGANRYKLAQHGLEEQLPQINRQGVELVRQVAQDADKEVYIAGDVGPLGVRLAPFGRVQPEQARLAFGEQIRSLAEAGADLIILETFSDLSEILEALAASRQVCDLPVVASLTYTRDDLTLLGDSPIRVARTLTEAGSDLIGVNCSGGPAQIWRILKQMHKAAPEARFSAMPNAGWPEQVGGRIMYPANPDYFGDYALAFCEAGARLVGGCCGTTPQHIAAMRQSLDTLPQGCAPPESELAMPAEVHESEQIESLPSVLARNLADSKFVISVEMDPPRGLSTHKLLAGASLLAESGADVINVADSPMARMRMSPWAVCELIQRQVGVDTTLHFPTRGRNLLRVQGDLLAAHALGIRNVFVVMGDPTAIGDYPEAMDDYDLVPSGLIRLIKRNFNIGLDHAGVEIGQPTSFFVGAALNLCPPDLERETRTLRRKLQSGVDFLLTQPVFEPHKAENFINNYTDQFGSLQLPVLVGVLPLYSPRHTAFLHNEVPGITIPETIQSRIRQAGDKSPWEGVQVALELVERFKPWASGVYLMPQFGRYDLAAEIVEGILKS